MPRLSSDRLRLTRQVKHFSNWYGKYYRQHRFQEAPHGYSSVHVLKSKLSLCFRRYGDWRIEYLARTQPPNRGARHAARRPQRAPIAKARRSRNWRNQATP